MIREAIKLVVEGQDLDLQDARKVMKEMMLGIATPAQIGAFITAMRMKGETADELLGFATVMRENSSHISAPENSVDLCGTGGDGFNTFNISTVASFVAAAAGSPVAKHGNRSISSRSGSSDLLSALGFPIDLEPKSVEKTLHSVGIGFMFAPLFHSSMKNVALPRNEVGIRSFFNILGPLTNPANVQRQLIGVFDVKLAVKMAHVLRELGTRHAIIANCEGMDEISNTGETRIIELHDGKIRNFSINPEMFELERTNVDSLKGGDPTENARIALSVLGEEKSPRRDVVAMNAGAAIYISGKAESIGEGIRSAFEVIETGSAMNKLKEYSSLIMLIEREHQRTINAQALLQRKIHPDILRERYREISQELVESIQKSERHNLLEMIDERIISHPTILSVFALNRILKLPEEDNQESFEKKRAIIRLSESIKSADGMALIAEYKPKSPSSLPLTVPPDPNLMATIFQSAGIAGISILGEPDFFNGSPQLISQFRSHVSLPILFKDFVLSVRQINIARSVGADAVLLIAKALNRNALDLLIDECIHNRLEPLVELHDEDDVRKLSSCDLSKSVKLVGINSRNLETLETDLSKIHSIRALVDRNKIVVAESGINSIDDIKSLKGFDAVLIGSLFMRASNPSEQVSEIISACRSVEQ